MKTMRVNRIIIFLIFCFSFHYANAQLNDAFEKGTITTIENEKKEGYIKTDDLSHLSSEVCFKSTENEAKYNCYNTSQIKSFQTETGKTYDMLSIKINDGSIEIAVFANLILLGETSLYKTVYDAKTFYIVVREDKNYVLQNDEIVFNEVRKYNYEGLLNVATEGFFMRNFSEIAFTEKDFIKVITQYNASKGNKSKVLTYKEKNIRYSILTIGGGGRKNESEFFLQANYRLFNPKISKSTSLNFGLNYYKYQFREVSGNKIDGFKQSLISFPLQLQQNILNKSIRPYIFAGLNLSYLKVVDNNNNSLIQNGIQSNFGIGSLFGLGIEIDIYKGIMLKSESRYEVFSHLTLFGVSYNFSKMLP